MAGTRGGLEQSGIHPREVMDLEDLGSRVGTVLGEAAVHGDTVGIELDMVSLVDGNCLPIQ